MHQAGPASRPFVLATLRALRLDTGPYPVLPARRPNGSKTTGRPPIDRPHPFRDDHRDERGEETSRRASAAAAKKPAQRPDWSTLTDLAIGNASAHSVSHGGCAPRFAGP